MQDTPDKQDRLLSLIEGYMKQTSIESPMRPDQFLGNMAYSNGSEAEGAKPMDKALVGEYTEKQLRLIKANQIRTKTRSVAN